MDGEQIPALGTQQRRARRATGLTQEELAERAGVSARTISDLERGVHHSPHTDTVALLAKTLGLRDIELTAFVAAAGRLRAPATLAPTGEGPGTGRGGRQRRGRRSRGPGGGVRGAAGGGIWPDRGGRC